MADDNSSDVLENPTRKKKTVTSEERHARNRKKVHYEEEQAYKQHHLAEVSGQRLRKLALDSSLKASPKLRREIEELAEDIEKSVGRLARKARSEEALVKQIEASVEKAESYIRSEAELEAQEEREQEKHKEAHEHALHAHTPEKPESASKSIQEKAHDKLEAFRAELRGEASEGQLQETSISTKPFSQEHINQLGDEQKRYQEESEKARVASLSTEEMAKERVEEIRQGTYKGPIVNAPSSSKISSENAQQEIDTEVHKQAVQEKINRTRADMNDQQPKRRLSGHVPSPRPAQLPPLIVSSQPVATQVRLRSVPINEPSYEIQSFENGIPESSPVMDRGNPASGNTRGSSGNPNQPQAEGEQQASHSGKRLGQRPQGGGGRGSGLRPSNPSIRRGGFGGAKGAAKKVVTQAAKKAAISAFRLALPYILAGAVILLVVLFFFWIIAGAGSESQGGAGQKVENPLKINKTGPASATVGQELVYQITVNYPGSAEDVIVSDPIPEGTDYVSSNPVGTYDPAKRTITWSAKELKLPVTAPINIQLGLTLRSTQNNLTLVNQASVNLVGGQMGGGGGNFPPTQDNCGGKYDLKNPLGNFGDPPCDFDKQKLGAQLQLEDPANAQHWDSIVECESRYNPNAYNPNSASGKGAYGLFQMNPAGQGNNQYDAGSVYWSQQITNAIEYNKRIRGSFLYWACK